MLGLNYITLIPSRGWRRFSGLMESMYVGVSLIRGPKARSPAMRRAADPGRYRLKPERQEAPKVSSAPLCFSCPETLDLGSQDDLGEARGQRERCGPTVTHSTCPWFCPWIRIVVSTLDPEQQLFPVCPSPWQPPHTPPWASLLTHALCQMQRLTPASWNAR